MSSAYWYVIFLPGYNRSDYCPAPRGNPFNVLFNTEMLVSCPRDTIMREWYSVHSNRTSVFELAKWEPNGKLSLLTELNLNERRNNLEGLIIPAVLVMNDQFTEMGVDGNISGLCGKILLEVTRNTNFSFAIVKRVQAHGRYKSKRNAWTGAVGELVANRAEFAIAYVSMSSSRLNAVDFTLPFILSSFSLYIKEPDIVSIEWSNYFQTFSHELWIAIIMLILTAPLLLVFIMIVTGERNMRLLISDCYFQMWGIICQQGLVEFPQRSSLRLAYISLFITSMVFSAAYSAALISFLTDVMHNLPFLSLEEFVKDGTYKLIVPKDSLEYDVFANSQKPLAKKVMSLMKDEESLPLTALEGFVQLCSQHKLALYISTEVENLLNPEIPCNVARIHIGHIDSISMMWKKKSQFLQIINHYVFKLMTNGVIKRLKVNYKQKKYTRKVGVSSIQVWSVIPILLFLKISIVLSVCVLIAEKLYFARQRKKLVKSKKEKVSKK
ncbi:hypothetical protein KPH14_005513 [Odynerus spinipes]|uniref:Uncharacterized protein n=1 Tax=Odynerus spinipes TaxID=1348599 RepID=A0AAD9VJH0_9HYME|nr:hypothetical protein KPH14_005513 [Odynerus spinipes]